MLTQTLTRGPARNRVFLVLIIALFAVPLAVAWLLVGQWRPAGTASHGELLSPARLVPRLQVRQADGFLLSEAYLRGRWTLLYMNEAVPGCDETCRDHLYTMRQTRLALGRDMGRVQGLLILGRQPDAGLSAWLGREHAGMPAGVADSPSRDFFERAFPGPGVGTGWIYLIDPLGNLVMRYGAGTDPEGLLEDLRRLLKLSKIG